MRIGNIAGTVGRILVDQRQVVNPFGIRDAQGRPFTVTLRRGNHDEWVNFLVKNELLDPRQKEARKKRVRLSMQKQKGFRHGGQKAREEKLLEQIAEDSIQSAVDFTASQEKLVRKKEGAAELLFLGGFGLDDEDG